ncbi:hypothetical protein ASC61_08295 [Aeromicrobium sp. Root344]|uniref:M12 family metallo-peptidase n=1 Tax=Aeromicrobium sp. Root344 TaxID=1736521 RepID=UPI0006F6A02F|nr:M12 family metallo-peptidase [Aeromicrobium sp. Root344]KQV74996.1 hypothetical protein ASC61_08295 [Aeromicrobium sp. Root344]
MRTRLALAAALSCLAASIVVVPSSATAVPLAAAGRHYEDPRYADHAAVAVDGTLIRTELDQFGTSPASSTAYAVRIDDGTLVPVSATSELPADARFHGELAITGRASTALKAKGLMPSGNRTIDEDSPAGSIALAAAAQGAAAQGAALPVAEATVTAPAVAATATPQAHRAYVVKLTDQGSVNGTDEEIAAEVDDMLGYWQTQSAGAITTFSRVGTIKPLDSTANVPAAQGCGIKTPDPLWDQAKLLFPGVSFSAPGNHLIVLLGDECGNSGPVGQARVGTSIANGGLSMLTVDDTFTQVGAHELGHNFGLQHANLDTCPSSALCEYYDLYSPMSLAVSGNDFQPPALGSLLRSQLKLADSVTTVALPSGSSQLTKMVSLAPRSGPSGIRGVLVTDPVTGITYSVDLRNRTGPDAGAFYGSPFVIAGTPDYRTGVVIERAATSAAGDEPLRTYLMTHHVGEDAVGAYEPGETFQPRPHFTIAVGAFTTGGSVAVTVTIERPAITGTVKVGSTVTAQPGTWPVGTVHTYQWKLNQEPVAGATNQTYVPRISGRTLTVTVTSTPPGGAPTTETSAGTIVARGTFKTVVPTITGTPKVGRTLSAHHGTWSPTPTWHYRWYANGSPISGATGSSYVVTTSRAGQRITVKVSGSKAYYVTASRTSARTSTVTR